jgi:hypothetical protein
MNSSTNLDEIGSIRAALLRVAGSQLSGTQIRALVDVTCPTFDVRAAVGIPTGPGALSTFLKTNFSDIVHIVGKKGGDNVYLIGPPRTDSPRTDFAAASDITLRPPSVWAAFASPGLGQEVVFDRVDNSLSVQARGSVVSEHQVRLAPISTQEFRGIAERFVGSTPEDIQDELRRILEQGVAFYEPWITVLKRRNPALYHRWGLFRVQGIVDLFRERLVTANVAPEEVEKAVRSLVADQEAAYKQRANALRTNIPLLDRSVLQRAPQAPVLVSETADVSDARAMATLMINYMSVTEIRQLSVPFGAVIDAGLLSRK